MKQKEKIRDFLRLSEKELYKILSDKKEKLRQFKFDVSAGKLKNVREIRETRRDIARILTILTARSKKINKPERAKEDA
jgi:large subunit ribosomal protein L29